MSKVHKLTFLQEMVDLVDEINPPAIEIHGKKFVQVVRCKDCCHCIYNEFLDTYHCWKFSWSIPVEKDGFCSWGKRREDVQESD